MKPNEQPFAESEIPLFDVFVKVPPHANFEDIARTVQGVAGLTPDQAERLVSALRNGPPVKIGTGVSQDRADKARAQFSTSGLTVVVSPVLILKTMATGSFDGLFVCPACNGRVVLPQNRQCPDCGVFVDKVTEEFLLKRKIMEQERAKLAYQADRDTKESLKLTRHAMEMAIRAQVRKELEAELGLNEGARLFGGKAGLLRATGLAGLVALAFVGGNALPQSSWPWAKTANTSQSAESAKVDVLLDNIAPQTAPVADASSSTGDADIDDLLKRAGNPGGKSLSLDQALAAANTLGKALGNTTAERAWAGTGAAPTGTATAATAGPVAGATAIAPASPQTQGLLSAEFAKQLAELGQWQRAQDVLKTLKATPSLAAVPAIAAAVRAADLEVQAWAIGPLSEGRARHAADTLRSACAALEDPVERARALGRVGVILTHHGQLPAAASQAFLTLAGQALKSIPDANQRAAAVGDWMVFMGQALVAEATLQARSGQWKKARATSVQLDELIKQAAADSTQARLYALDSQIRQTLGQPDQSRQSLALALSLTGKAGHPLAQATLLRAVASLSGAPALEPVQGAVRSLLVQLESLSGLEKAQALTQLALLQADAGWRTRADQYSRMARDTPGMSPADASVVNADLIARGHMATATVLHRQGQYAESEALLQSLAGYLL